MWEFVIRSLEASMIFIFAGLGELIDQRSGVLNVGVEGVMLFGATLGFITAQTTGSYLLGFLVGIAIGGLLGFLHGFISVTLGVDQVVSGMGIWIIGFGLTTYIGNPYTGPLGMERIPTIAGLSPFFYIGIVLVVVSWFVLNKTSLGLNIRSVGEDPSVAEVSGINVTKTRYLCATIGGMFGGLAGAIYSLFYIQLSPGLGFHCPGFGIFLYVEPVDPAGRFLAFWNPVATFAQSPIGASWCAIQVCLENDSLLYHHCGFGDYLDKVV
jgi:simple sugar transport system permease protein